MPAVQWIILLFHSWEVASSLAFTLEAERALIFSNISVSSFSAATTPTEEGLQEAGVSGARVFVPGLLHLDIKEKDSPSDSNKASAQ